MKANLFINEKYVPVSYHNKRELDLISIIQREINLCVEIGRRTDDIGGLLGSLYYMGLTDEPICYSEFNNSQSLEGIYHQAFDTLIDIKISRYPSF